MLTTRAHPRTALLAGTPPWPSPTTHLQHGPQEVQGVRGVQGPEGAPSGPQPETTACEYVLTMMPIWAAFRCAGAWPGTVSKDGRFHRSLFSTLTALSAALFMFTSWRFVVTLLYRIEITSTLPPEDFAHKVLNLQFIMYLLAQFTAVCTCLEMTRVSQYAARWAAFQPKLERACGGSISNPTLRRSVLIHVWMVGVGWPLAVLVPLSLSASEMSMSIFEVLTYAYVTTVLNFTSTQWRMQCAFVENIAGVLRRAFVEVLRSEEISKQNVATFQTVWQELSELHNMSGTVIGFSTMLNMTIYSLTLIQCAYHTLYSVFRGFTNIGYFLLFVGSLTMFTLSRIFNAAHVVNEELGTKFKQVLLAKEIGNAPRDALQQLDAFRSVMHNHPAHLHLLGFLPINRSSLGALWTTMATYLVVLIQFTLQE